MFDSITRRIGKIVNFVRAAPAEHVRRDNVKALRQRADIVLPGYFRGGAILAAVKQDKVWTLSSFDEVSFDVADA